MLELVSSLVLSASICSVQTGTLNLPSQDAGAPTLVTISPVADARSVFFYGYRVSSQVPSDHMVGMEGVVDAGTLYALQFKRARGSADAVAVWYVATFCSGVVAERGTMAVTPSSVAVHTPMAVTQSWGTTLDEGGGTTFDENDHYRVRPLSNTQLEVADTDPLDLGNFTYWQVFENDGMTVQHGIGTFDAGTLTATETAAAVPAGSSFSRVTWRIPAGTPGANGNAALSSRYLGNGMVDVSRSLAMGSVEYAWDLVRFTDGTRVFTGRQSFNTGEPTIFLNLGASVDLNRAVAFTAGHDSRGRFTGSPDPGNARFTAALPNPNQILLQRAVSPSTAIVDWIVLEFPDGGMGGGAGGGSGGSGGGSAGGSAGGTGGGSAGGSAGGMGGPAELQLVLPQTQVRAGELTALIAVRVLDASKNPVAVRSDLTVALNSSSSRGGFVLRQTDSIANPLDVVIRANGTETGVYYKDFSAGVDTLTAAAPGLVGATATLEITAATQSGCSCASAPGWLGVLAIAVMRRSRARPRSG